MLETAIEHSLNQTVKDKLVIDSLREGMAAISQAITAFHELGMTIESQFFEEYFMENPNPTVEEILGMLLVNAEIELDQCLKN